MTLQEPYPTDDPLRPSRPKASLRLVLSKVQSIPGEDGGEYGSLKLTTHSRDCLRINSIFLNIAFIWFGLTFEAFSELIQLFNIHEVFQNELEFQ